MSIDNSASSVLTFTFHNVSINSVTHRGIYKRNTEFTFHNVSINSESFGGYGGIILLFTFHNVSINSDIRLRMLRNKEIYIP